MAPASPGRDLFHYGQHLPGRRRSERRACSLAAVIGTAHGEARAQLLDVSAGGIGFTTATLMPLRPGEKFLLRHEQIGEVRCIVRWSMHPRYGAEFDPPGRTPPAVNAFYDSLPPGPGESG